MEDNELIQLPGLRNGEEQVLGHELTNDFGCESNFETGKNESFADDSTTLILLEYDDLSTLKNCLSEFATLSGLKCNFEKTSIMRIGNLEGEIDQRILDLGFEVVDECKLLGFCFSNRQSLGDANKDILIEKISNVIRFWTPFNLLISGKITVAKSLMLPLFNYFATVISFDAETLSQIGKKIEKFVTSGLNISKDKIYSAVDKGGINLFNLADFAMCLQAFWIKRASDLTHDNWHRQLINLNPLGVGAITTPDTLDCGPILKGILTNFIAFRNAYGTAHNNFIAVPILYNDNFSLKRGGVRFLLTRNFFFMTTVWRGSGWMHSPGACS
jgi:hypothetical protein